jgi:hypothetical protein
MTIRSRLAAVLAMATMATVAAVGLATPASAQSTASAPFCGQYWGSLPKGSDVPLSYSTLLKVRAGQHDCYDRMVIDIDGQVGGYAVQYDPEHTLFSSPDPAFYPRGGAYLVIYVKNAVIPRPSPSHASTAVESADEAVNVSGFRTFRQIKELIYGGLGSTGLVGDTLALGVRARLPFRVFTLQGPGSMSRLVIDVAHRW